MDLTDRIMECLHGCEIPYDEREVILDRRAGQILVPVKIMVTETHLTCLKNRLPAKVTGIELGTSQIRMSSPQYWVLEFIL